MAVNPHWQTGIPESDNTYTQDLYEELIIESIQIKGFEMYYIPRTLIKVDMVLSEVTMSEFKDAIPIEMSLENIQGFEGDGGFLSKFGIEVNDSCTFTVARKRWKEEVGNKNKTTLTNRPNEGDILFFPMTKSFFEIKKVHADDPFYQVGKLYVFKMDCELFRYASELFNTGNDEIDNIINGKTFEENPFQIGLEDEDGSVLSEHGTPVDLSTPVDEKGAGAQNTTFVNQAIEDLDFSEDNPFGEVKRR